MYTQNMLTEENAPVILIVDDLEAHLELMEAILTREGYKVRATLHPEEALQIIREFSPDLAILDVMMPGMNGYELCKKLKVLSKENYFPVILVTSLNQLSDKINGIESGADDFFSKPFNNIELTTKIRSLIKLKRLQDELESSENIIFTLAIAIEAKDPYTKGHSERVGNLSSEFASFIGLSETEVINIKKGGILHDIGKIGLSENILHKGHSLSPEDWELVKRHPSVGMEICKPLYSLRQLIPIITHHHERWDGRGYPQGLKGEEIPLSARIVNVIDTFDAMISIRPYRTICLTKEHVTKIMDNERLLGQWDPYLVKKFLEMVS